MDIHIRHLNPTTRISQRASVEIEDSGIQATLKFYGAVGNVCEIDLEMDVTRIQAEKLVQTLATEKDVEVLYNACMAELRIRKGERCNVKDQRFEKPRKFSNGKT